MTDLPVGFTNRMKSQLGSEYADFISCYDLPCKKALRFNRSKTSPVDYALMCRILTGKDAPEEVRCWSGAFMYSDDGPGASPLHEAGVFYIQEPSAMLPVTLLDVDDSSLKVLDLCAAPGGKSTQITDLMRGRGLLVSNEVIQKRAAVLSGNIERMGIANALVISADPDRLAERFPAYFDRILVDAPCSGEGMFRKNPEAVKEWSEDNVKMCATRQKWLLDCASLMLSPGGRIVYSTCTFSPEEDEEVTEHFLKTHPEFTIEDGPYKMYPHTFPGEGHYAVSFVHGDTASRRTAPELPKEQSACVFEGIPLPSAVSSDNMNERIVRFGESVYIAPEYMPDLDGLKVCRTGLKIGTYKKNRFDPDHALSHALTKDEADHFIDLAPDSPEVRGYLSGMTLNCDKDIKGWCLVTVMGYPLGWGKAVGGVLKNHYPSGLRKPWPGQRKH
ncbi:MAG: RsmF rRNA methyltransferase first C-terminal domain-containing protein [Lachnospiraceae bacterium]|nr:RsmF rRNA methyltransferase first C-terminal domain-containing protein [Lachnospiraceae bacterium]